MTVISDALCDLNGDKSEPNQNVVLLLEPRTESPGVCLTSECERVDRLSGCRRSRIPTVDKP